MERIYIYALIDPHTNKIRYVGKTNNIKHRYKQHRYPKKNDTTKRANWLRELKSEGLQPIIKVIDVTDETLWSDMEKQYIREYSHLDLLNATEGGQDGKHSLEVKKKIGEGVSKAHKGRKLSKEWKTNIGKSLGKQIVINGITYNSRSEAGRQLNASHQSINRRCHSDKYPEYKFL